MQLRRNCPTDMFMAMEMVVAAEVRKEAAMTDLVRMIRAKIMKARARVRAVDVVARNPDS